MGRGKEKRVNLDLSLFKDPTHLPNYLKNRGLFDDEGERERKIALYRADSTKKNIGYFYSCLYSWVLGGSVKASAPAESNGGPGYLPDVVHNLRSGRKHIEVKAFSNRTAKGLCPTRQFENYVLNLFYNTHLLEQSGSHGTPFLGFDYAFFRYRVPITRVRMKRKLSNGSPAYKRFIDGPNLTSLSPAKMLESFQDKTTDLLSVPPNVALLLFYHTSAKDLADLNETRAVSAQHWPIKSGDITALHRSQNGEGLEYILNESDVVKDLPGIEARPARFGTLTPSTLLFDKLDKTQIESPSIIVNGKYKISPFPVTLYRLPSDYISKFNASFYSNRKEIFGTLGMHKGYGEPTPI